MQLTLIVPELIWPEPADAEVFDDASCPGLRRLLGRSRLARRAPQSFEATLCDAFDLAANVPYAALRRLGEAELSGTMDDSNAYWTCSDPVHLRYHEELLVLAEGGSGGFDIAADEALALVEALNAHFPELGRFHAATPERWYLELASPAALASDDVAPLSNIAGRSLDHERPTGAEQKARHRLLAEIQMLLHAHPINRKREAAGRLSINSVWLWGGGALPLPRKNGAHDKAFDGVWSVNALARGLARFSGTTIHAETSDAATLLAQASPGTRHCVVLEDLLPPVQYEQRDAYRHTLAALEKYWFAPLLAGLRNGKIQQLRIESSTAYAALVWESTRREQWAFWKRPASLNGLARDLARE